MPIINGYFYPGVGMVPNLGKVESFIISGTQTAIIDGSGYFSEMTHYHSKGHKGQIFICSNEKSIAANTSVFWLIKTPPSDLNNQYIHFSYNVDVDGQSKIYFFEQPTISTSGSEFSVLNINRNSSNVISDVNLYASASVFVSGTQLAINRGTPENPTNGGALTQTFIEEWILKPSTYYLIKVFNKSALIAIDTVLTVKIYYAGASSS